MTPDQWTAFTSGALKVTPKPETHFAKKIAKIQRTNPFAKVKYAYDKWYAVSFTDGTSIEVSNDYIEGHTKFAVGGYVIATRPDYAWGFCTEDQFSKLFL